MDSSNNNKRLIRRWMAPAALCIALGLHAPTAVLASWVDFDNPLTVTNGYTVVDRMDPFDPFGGTSFQIDFTGTIGVWLAMEARHSYYGGYAPVNEHFSFFMRNMTGETINKVSLEFRKPDEVPFTSTPESFYWATSIVDQWSSASWGQVQIDWSTMQLIETESSVRAELSFQSGHQWEPGVNVYFNLAWNQFNYPRADWLLNIDLNEIDLNDPTVPVMPSIETPIPAAVWLFGGSLLGILAIGGRRRRART